MDLFAFPKEIPNEKVNILCCVNITISMTMHQNQICLILGLFSIGTVNANNLIKELNDVINVNENSDFIKRRNQICERFLKDILKLLRYQQIWLKLKVS